MEGTAGGQALRLESHWHVPRDPNAWRVVSRRESDTDRAGTAGQTEITWHLLHHMKELYCLLKTTRDKKILTV